jgi:cell wall-associated NlpC family hydrolase
MLSLLVLVSLTPVQEQALVQAARRNLGVRYHLGGRMRRGEGIDCQGVVFFALQRAFGCSWRSYSVYPTETVVEQELGPRVPGLDPIASEALEIERLRPGDVLMLVDFSENPAEPAIGELRGKPVWVWHVGMYTGAGKWIVGDHFAGAVVEVDLREYLREHADTYAGVFVTRMTTRSCSGSSRRGGSAASPSRRPSPPRR